MTSERNESTRPGGAGAVRPESLANWGLMLAKGRLRRTRAAAGFASAVAVVALASACATSNPTVPGWIGAGSGRPQAGNAPASAAALLQGSQSLASAQAVGSSASATPAPNGDRPLTPPPLSISAPAAHDAASAGAAGAQFGGVTPSAGTWAVVIGIDTYPGGGAYNLESAVNDANDMVTALEQMGVPANHVLLVRDGQATAGAITASADWLVAHADSESNAVFFYAGHTEKLSPSTEALIGSDGGQVTNADLAGHFSRLAAARSWFVFAACFGGGFDNLLGPGRIVTAAADANHLAYENETFHRSYLVEYMVRQAMIEGRAPGSVQNAFAYAVASIHRDYPGREPVEADDLGAPFDLRSPDAVQNPPSPPPEPSSSVPPGPPSPPNPPSAPNTPPPTSPPSTAPPPGDACGSLTLGVVRCGS